MRGEIHARHILAFMLSALNSRPIAPKVAVLEANVCRFPHMNFKGSPSIDRLLWAKTYVFIHVKCP